MGQSLGINMIDMYVKLVEEEFAPLFTMAEIQIAAIRPHVERKVKVDLGIDEIDMEIATYKAAIAELEDRKNHYMKTVWKKNQQVSKFHSEVEMRLENINEPYRDLKATAKQMVKKIKLSGSTPEIATAMAHVDEVCEKLAARFEALPSPEVTIKRLEGEMKKTKKTKK